MTWLSHIKSSGNCLLIKMSKADLRKTTGIAPNTMTRLRRNEEVTLTVLHKICLTLDAEIGDIMKFLPGKNSNTETL